MLVVEQIKKFRDNNDNIIGYRLRDFTPNGTTQDVKADILKQKIKEGKVIVTNLTLTSDNRLIDKAAEKLESKQLGPKLDTREVYSSNVSNKVVIKRIEESFKYLNYKSTGNNTEEDIKAKWARNFIKGMLSLHVKLKVMDVHDGYNGKSALKYDPSIERDAVLNFSGNKQYINLTNFLDRDDEGTQAYKDVSASFASHAPYLYKLLETKIGTQKARESLYIIFKDTMLDCSQPDGAMTTYKSKNSTPPKNFFESQKYALAGDPDRKVTEHIKLCTCIFYIGTNWSPGFSTYAQFPSVSDNRMLLLPVLLAKSMNKEPITKGIVVSKIELNSLDDVVNSIISARKQTMEKSAIIYQTFLKCLEEVKRALRGSIETEDDLKKLLGYASSEIEKAINEG